MKCRASLLVATACITSGVKAQTSPDSTPLTDRIFLAASANVQQTHAHQQQPTVWRDGGVSVTLRSFIDDHWQLGIGPSVQGFYDDLNGTNGSEGMALFASYGMNAPFHTRVYIVGQVAQSTASRSIPTYGSQWRAGVMRFLSPETALRVEFRTTAMSTRTLLDNRELYVGFDQYFDRHAAAMRELPGWGMVDVSAYGDATLAPDETESFAVSLAPFITSWLQVGGSFNMFRIRWDPSNVRVVHDQVALARIYAPLSPGLMPFIGGQIQGGTYDSDVPGISTYAGSVGARHWIRSGLAVDGGLSLEAHNALPGFRRLGNTLGMFADIVLPLDLRHQVSR
jgi:hypothetical protein